MNINDFFWPGPRLPMSGALLLVALACALVVTLPAGGGTRAIPPSLSIADASVGEGMRRRPSSSSGYRSRDTSQKGGESRVHDA